MTRHPSTMYSRPKPNDPDLIHVVCCEYDSIALCSLDVSDQSFVDQDKATTCVVCAELQYDDKFCPVKGTQGCLP